MNLYESLQNATSEEDVKAAIKSGEIVRTQITPDNLKQVFDRWVQMVGREIAGVAEDEYALLFFADVMSDGTVSTHENLSAELIHRNGRPAFLLEGRVCNLGSLDGYHRYWGYLRPYAEGGAPQLPSGVPRLAHSLRRTRVQGRVLHAAPHR